MCEKGFLAGSTAGMR